MHIRWSPEAADDLERIHRRIHRDNPAAAGRVVRTIYQECNELKKHPRRGRTGREVGSSELVLTPLPYVVVYRDAES